MLSIADVSMEYSVLETIYARLSAAASARHLHDILFMAYQCFICHGCWLGHLLKEIAAPLLVIL